MVDNQFFDEQTEQSLVKAAIVGKYFKVWANVIMISQDRNRNIQDKRLAYIDLFAGPGRYKSGAESTPVKIIEHAISNKKLRSRLVTMFNDMDEENCKSLETTISAIPGLESLTHQPQVNNDTIGEDIVKMFEETHMVPTLFFVDPWGYKGLSLRLVNSVVKDWGCDCVFFFNYNRINAGITNKAVESHLISLFGENRLHNLQERVENTDPTTRELLVVEDICQALKESGDGERYVLPFRFKHAKGKRTMHHLIFVSKHFRGYDIMKNIMASESSSSVSGVSSFEYNPADKLPQQTLLFQLSRPIEDLKQMLLTDLSGKKLTFLDVYESHSVGKPYIKKHYKTALAKMYENKEIGAERRNGKKIRKGTFPDDMIAIFSEK